MKNEFCVSRVESETWGEIGLWGSHVVEGFGEERERGLKFLGLGVRKGFYGYEKFVVMWEEIRPRWLGGMNEKKIR